MPAIKPDYQKWYDGLSPDHRALVDKDPTYEYIFKGTAGALDSAGKRPSSIHTSCTEYMRSTLESPLSFYVIQDVKYALITIKNVPLLPASVFAQ